MDWKEKLQEIRTKHNLLNITVEEGEISENTIIHGDKEFTYIASEGGYTLKTPIKLIEKHPEKCDGKVVIIRHKTGGFSTGTMFGFWAIYVSTGRIVTGRKV